MVWRGFAAVYRVFRASNSEANVYCHSGIQHGSWAFFDVYVYSRNVVCLV